MDHFDDGAPPVEMHSVVEMSRRHQDWLWPVADSCRETLNRDYRGTIQAKENWTFPNDIGRAKLAVELPECT